MESFTFETTSPEQTERLGICLAGIAPAGTVIALRGELAAGKTCLVRGIARARHCTSPVSSPTFTIVNEYACPGGLFHLDLYRLDTAEVIDLGYEEYFDRGEGLTVVEWAERAESLLPEQRIDVSLEHAGEDLRRITVTPVQICTAEDWKRVASVDLTQALPGEADALA